MTEKNVPTELRSWLAAPLSADVAQSVERLRYADDVQYLALMPDVHLASDVCVGVVLATRRTIYPAAIGSDLGCGMAALGFEAGADLLADERFAARVLSGLQREIPAIKHPPERVVAELPPNLQAKALSELGLSEQRLSDSRLEKLKARDGRFQFGTLGRGNHFVEFQADQQDRLWLMLHSGSRGMGQAITAHHVRQARAAGAPGKQSKLINFDDSSPAGQAYLADVAWAIDYAAENRLAMAAAVERLLQELFGVKALPGSLIHANHNHVRREEHAGETYWVHRKGALSAAAGEPGVIPGSMGAASFHVVGRGHAPALCSSSHGAGRNFSRGEAARRINAKRLLREIDGVWFDHRRLALLRDEAPSAYKDIHAVMRAQRDLTCIERELRPLLSYKGV